MYGGSDVHVLSIIRSPMDGGGCYVHVLSEIKSPVDGDGVMSMCYQ